MLGLMRNIAASGGVNTKTLRAAESSTRAASESASVSRAPRQSGPKASMEGYNGGRSTYVKSNNTGYGAVRDVRSKGPGMPDIPGVNTFTGSGVAKQPIVDDLSGRDYNPFRADAQLAKLLQ